MKHYGDITKLSGHDLPMVDVITGGSPCQDLSIAGKRVGLDGERSGLFMEQIRIVKEMRERDKASGRTGYLVRPRYMVWENVPGAFSSNNGKDFKMVLEEIVKIEEPEAPSLPEIGRGGWTKSGFIYDELGRWSIAWRVHDAQFWGVPQRRKRIALVADFGGLSAGEICFEREGLRWDPGKSEKAGEGTAENTERSAHNPVAGGFCTEHSSKARGVGYQDECSPTLRAGVVPAAVILNDQGGERMDVTRDVTMTLRAEAHHPPIVLEGNGTRESHHGDGFRESEVMYTLNSTEVHAVCSDAISINPRPMSMPVQEGIAATLGADDYKQPQAVYTWNGESLTNPLNRQNPKEGICHTLSSDGRNYVSIENHPTDGRVKIREDGTVQTLCGRMGTGGNNVPLCMDVGMFSVSEDCSALLLARQYKDAPVVNNGVLRRLTPMDCERLQGFPDGWTDIGAWVDSKGKTHKESSDSARYKALGNSIALPFWFFLLRRIAAQYERPATLGSLFDGIAGFPLCWERCNGKGTAIWASEIEEFPIAVTKKHFPEGEEDEAQRSI